MRRIGGRHDELESVYDAISEIVAGKRCAGHSVSSRFRTQLTVAGSWDGLLAQVNEQIQTHDIMGRKGGHIVRALRKVLVNLGKR